ncbi:MAG: LysR family transcriptional regulator [Betaproteobacteria bacterium]|nr:LysR family transcriptional regulator [Betaproteobacteria bacterium]
MNMNLDLGLLRTLIAIADTGGFARAGVLLHQTQPTVSLRMRRLEEHLGEVLFQRQGRQMVLTAQAELLITYGRKLLALNDEAAMAVKRTAIEGNLRIGAPEDISQTILPAVLKRFVQGHPKISLYVRSSRNTDLVASVKNGDLDLALAFSPKDVAGATLLKRYPVMWICGAEYSLPTNAPLPLVLFESPCMYREFALRALNDAEASWRVSYTATNVGNLLAAVKADLGVTARVVIQRESAMRYLGKPDGLPVLPEIGIWLCRGPVAQTAAAEKFQEFLQDGLDSLRF